MSNKTEIRVRFAPSPTGELHLGNVRSALYNFIFARQSQGKFFLRIEDTDRDRYRPESVEGIYQILKWLGLNWDEKPIIQSERLEIYRKYGEDLVKGSGAYYCFCSKERLEQLKKEQEAKRLPPCYDRHCRELDAREVARNLEANQSFVIRLKVPLTGSIEINDLIKNKVVFDLKLLDDPVLLKSDGYPTYHLASVVDDHESGITTVIRSDEWLASVPKHLLLYQFLGWTAPDFAHLPIILGPDKSKLSKRHGATSVLEFKNQGYLPEALINFMAFLGWNPGDDREIFSLADLIKEFRLEQVHKSPAIFNLEKLDWLNGFYIRQKSLSELVDLCLPYFVSANLISQLEKPQSYKIIATNETIDFDYLTKIVALERERLKKLSEIVELTRFFFEAKLDYDSQLLIWRKSNRREAEERLKILKDYLVKLPATEFRKETLERELKNLVEEKGLGTGNTFWPLRVALTGREASPGPFEVAEVLSKDKTVERLNQAIGKVSG